MKNGLIFKILAAMLCITGILQAAASANPFSQDVRIINMTITDDPTNLLLSLQVEGAFNEKLAEAVREEHERY